MLSYPEIQPLAPARCRRFNLGDALILTAGLAVAMQPDWLSYIQALPGLIRFWLDVVGRMLGWWVYPLGTAHVPGRTLAHTIFNFAAGFLGFPLPGLTLAALWFRLRRPRPTWPTLVRQPGFVGNLAAVGGFILFLEANWLGFAWQADLTIAGTIMTSWIALTPIRRWQAEPGWIDRTGRAISCAWLIATACGLLARWVSRWG